MPAGNNHQWSSTAAAVAALAADYPGTGLFIDQNPFTRDDWLGLAAVTADTASDASFFGTNALNILILAKPVDPTAADSYAAQRARIVAQFPKFAGYRTIVYADTGSLPNTIGGDSTVAGFEGTVQGVCEDLADYGFVYGGTVDYSSATAEDFRPAIEQFFGLSVG